MFCDGTPVFVGIGLIALVYSLSQNDWVKHEKLLPTGTVYFRINTTNVLRCGKLCERQSKCAAVTYDIQKTTCYLHDADTAKGTVKSGKYLYSSSVGSLNKLDTLGQCTDKQLYLPTADGHGRCMDLEFYLGCFRDKGGQRDLPHYIGLPETNSKTECISQCVAGGYRYSGLQNGRQCFCGYSYGNLGELSESKCDKSCPGNPSEKCGGFDAQNIYATGL